MRSWSIVNADLLDWLAGRSGFKAHAVLCDPPYFLGSIVKRLGKPSSAPIKYQRDGAFSRMSRGFMGQSWDGFDSVWHFQAWVTEWAGLLLEHVHPGAVGMFFGGTRTFHRLAAGLEDAGWILADTISYMYGSGFPKSHNGNHWGAGEQWHGYGTALKPSWEPVILARAPWNCTYSALAQQYGTGALNIDGGRVEGPPWARTGTLTDFRGGNYGGGLARKTREDLGVVEKNGSGRWPANTILGCACDSGEHKHDCAAAMLDAQSGELASGSGSVIKDSGSGYRAACWNTESRPPGTPCVEYGDTGGASRFFYTSKAAAWEREAGLHDYTPRAVGDGRDKAIDNPYQRGETPRRNVHPTVKPVDLARYLAGLILPPELSETRTLLVPFSGSGSEMIGAMLAGWDRVIGVEQVRGYALIARDRLRWWSQYTTIEQAKRAFDADIATCATRAAERAVGVEQLPLFAGVAP